MLIALASLIFSYPKNLNKVFPFLKINYLPKDDKKVNFPLINSIVATIIGLLTLIATIVIGILTLR